MASSRSAAADEAAAVIPGLYQEHYGSLVRVAFLLLGDLPEAEDTVQEAFLDFYRRGHARLHDADRAPAYLRGSVANLARSRLRRRAVLRRLSLTSSQVAPSAEERFFGHEQTRRVIQSLRRLSARQRECLILRYYSNMTESEIAEALGLGPSSVKTHLRRGLRMLSRQLEVDDE